MPDISVSEFAEQLTLRLREIEQKATRIKAEMAPLTHQREQALVAGNVLHSVALKHQLSELQERLEDLEITRAAIEGKLRIYAQNASEAAKAREKANAFWEEGRVIVDEFVKMQARARTLYKKALELEDKISGLGREHLRLVGRDMKGPPSITGTVYQLGAFAAQNVPDVKPLDAWQYIPDEEIAAQRKEELDRKLKAHEARIKVAEEHAPNCPNCARANVETKMVVDRRSGHDDTPGQAGSGHSSHHWYLICPRCGTRLTEPIPETK
jgi:hypothetical protein